MKTKLPLASIVALCLLTFAVMLSAQPAADSDLAKSPAEEARNLILADSRLELKLVVSEPDIVDPVAMAFDENGRLFVVEMTDYPSGPVSGRIRLLSNPDVSGRFTQNTLFATNLAFPNGVMPWNGGVLVTAAPDIIFLKDTDGDGIADQRKVVLTGFSPGNQQLRVNGLYWGVDTWIYGANGRSDGEVFWMDAKTGARSPAGSIRRRDFRFRIETHEFEAIAGNSQFGMGHDDWGNRFPVFNNLPSRQVVLEDRYFARSNFVGAPDPVISTATNSSNNKVFPLTPPVLLVPQPAGFFTSACGPSVYRGTALPPEYYGNIFVCEAAQSLISRRKIEPDGSKFKTVRTEEGREFLSSRDPYFHGVFTTSGPDGALYIVDFYRKFVEHPQWVAESLKATTPWRTGSGHGRIWKIQARSETPRTVPSPRMGGEATTALTQHLKANDAWWRETAQRLLAQRADKSIAPTLAIISKSAPLPQSRLLALELLATWNSAAPSLILGAMRDPVPQIRGQAIVISENLSTSWDARQKAMLHGELKRLAMDPDPRVRLQVALTSGSLPEFDPVQVLQAVASRPMPDLWPAYAIMSSAGEKSAALLTALCNQRLPLDASGRFLIEKLAAQTGAAGRITNTSKLLTKAMGLADDPRQLLVASGLTEGLAAKGMVIQVTSGLTNDISLFLGNLVKLAVNPARELWQRSAAIALIGRFNDPEVSARVLPGLLVDRSAEIGLAASRAIATIGNESSFKESLQSWRNLARMVRVSMVTEGVKNKENARAVLESIERGIIGANEVDLQARQMLIKHSERDLAAIANRVFKSQVDPNREAVLAAYQPAVTLAGSAARGGVIFGRLCLSCHTIQDRGGKVGPDLSGILSQPRATLLMNIIEPSKQVLPDYVSYDITLATGETVTGIVASENATSLTLRRPNAPDLVVLKNELKSMSAEGKSLMPDGLEQGLSVSDMSDLLDFLHRADPNLILK